MSDMASRLASSRHAADFCRIARIATTCPPAPGAFGIARCGGKPGKDGTQGTFGTASGAEAEEMRVEPDPFAEAIWMNRHCEGGRRHPVLALRLRCPKAQAS